MNLKKPILRRIIIAGTIDLLWLPTIISNKTYENKIQKMNQYSKVFQIESEIKKKELIHDGDLIHYYASGNSDNKLIVFLHPAFADHRAFDRQIDFFANNYRVITMDMPGHGLSQSGKAKIDHSIHYIHSIMDRHLRICKGFRKP